MTKSGNGDGDEDGGKGKEKKMNKERVSTIRQGLMVVVALVEVVGSWRMKMQARYRYIGNNAARLSSA